MYIPPYRSKIDYMHDMSTRNHGGFMARVINDE